MRRDLTIEITAEPRLLKAVRGAIRGYVTGLGFSSERSEEIVLAVDEACANSMRHSYANRCDGQITLELSSDANEVIIELRDCGIPAPADRIRPQKTLPPDVATLRPGGLGVQLMYQVFDAVEFTPGVDKGNRVVMRLRRPTEATECDRKVTRG